MKRYTALLMLTGCFLLQSAIANAEDGWPKTINSSNGSQINIYEPQPESFSGNILKERAAFSISTGDGDSYFGSFWMVARVETDRDNRIVHIISAYIPNLKLANDSSGLYRPHSLKTDIENGIPALNIQLSLDGLLSSLDMNEEEKTLSKNLSTTPPEIFYESEPSLLVLIDGQPIIQHNNGLGVDAVSNTAFTIIKFNDGQFYLYGGKHWYNGPSATGPFSYDQNIPAGIRQLQKRIDDANNSDIEYADSANTSDAVVSKIIVSTKPAELIQSNGAPDLRPIAHTRLDYVVNSDNDIFFDEAGQLYYILISGRWYKSSSLQGSWTYVAATDLPADFAKIPEGSPKDRVLASVAGTDAAREAILDAQIPQTAMVDRKTASVTVTYDGSPQFEDIPGTHLQYALNSAIPVLVSGGHYYCVDKGVWFDSNNPQGPWQISTKRPEEVDLIPPGSPVYNLKFVYIYDVNPDYVYVGYTPGYMNTFIFGPTVVYGTGFYYRPWHGHFFYPRPWTWGFNMWYNPWWGWTFGPDYGGDWFNWNLGFGWGFWYGGWWGPGIFRPAFFGHAYTNRGMYGRTGFAGNNRIFSNNIYRGRQGLLTRKSQQRITTDRNGNVFRRDAQGNWQQRDGNTRTWRSVDNTRQSQTIDNLNRQEQMRDRGDARQQNFQMSRGSFRSAGSFRGGGGRR